MQLHNIINQSIPKNKIIRGKYMSYTKLAQQLAEINKRMLSISEYTKITDTNRGEGVLLSYLVRHDKEATPIELSEALNVSTARIAALLNKLEKKNLVERQKHPDNNRNTIVKLLPKGEKLNKEQETIFNKKVIGFFETLGEEKAALFVELQGKMVDFLINEQTGEKNNE